MLAIQLATIFVILVGLIVTYFVLKKKDKWHIENKFLKTLSLTLALAFFFRYMLGDEALNDVFMLENYLGFTPFTMVMSLVLNWALYSVIIFVALYPFFKNSKYTVIMKYYVSIVSLLCLGFIIPLTKGIVGVEAYSGFKVRTLLMGVELGILIGYAFIVFWENNKFKIAKVDAKAFVYLIFMLLATMPSYMLEALFGHANYGVEIKDFTLPHRIILYGAIILPITLYFLLRKKDKEEKRGILLYISLGTLMSFMLSWKFYDFLDITHWPFHLCHTAMFIIPLCLIFKWEKLFYFTYFINVFGAFLAMLMPNTAGDANILQQSTVAFYINHYIAFFMPVLIVALKVYERPKLKEFKYSMIGFAGYFLLVLILNAWFSNYGTVDYFYINSNFVADKLGDWAEDLMDFTWTINIGNITMLFYPLYQFIYFMVYGLIAAGIWFVYEAGYSFVDTLYDIQARKQKIKADELALQVALGGRGWDEPMNKDGVNKIILRNFSKRYGKSDVYAVKDANLEINGGEIFGFLGHNGAGKSTIIKSIVGIQPITSGSIEVCGYDVDKQPTMAKKNIGFVPDHYALYEKLTGREYINYIADLYDVSKEDRDIAIEKYVKLFELGDAFDNQIKTYSHGMKQKITIISALVHNPKVWILDEPLTGLDPTSIYQVKECMREHAKKGNIVFFSSHLIDIVENLCDKVAVIKKGKILSCEKVSDIMQRETDLESYYLEMSSKRVVASKVNEEKLKETIDKEKEEKSEEKEQKI